MWAGGEFSSIGGQPRSAIAALDSASGLATGWNPNANGVVYSVAVDGGTAYVGGGFSSVGGKPRNFIAALDATTGLATGWNPNASHTVLALAQSGETVYLGGHFTSIGGQPRGHIAALESASGLVTFNWSPDADNAAHALVVSGETVFAGGAFSIIRGLPQRSIAAITYAPLAVPLPEAGRGFCLLEQSRPNPASISAAIGFFLSTSAVVSLTVFDLSGRAVARPLEEAFRGPGRHQVLLDTRSLRTGLYLYRLQAGSLAEARKLIVTR